MRVCLSCLRPFVCATCIIHRGSGQGVSAPDVAGYDGTWKIIKYIDSTHFVIEGDALLGDASTASYTTAGNLDYYKYSLDAGSTYNGTDIRCDEVTEVSEVTETVEGVEETGG